MVISTSHSYVVLGACRSDRTNKVDMMHLRFSDYRPVNMNYFDISY